MTLAPDTAYTTSYAARRRIAELALLIDQAEDDVARLKDRATLTAADIGKNDIARKALVSQLLDGDTSYQRALDLLRGLKHEKAQQEAELEIANAQIRRGEWELRQRYVEALEAQGQTTDEVFVRF